MIAARLDSGESTATTMTVNLQLPAELSEAIMLLARSARVLFPQTFSEDPQHCWPGSAQRLESPPATAAAAVESREPRPETTAAEQPESMLGLLMNAPIQLHQKRLRASQKQQTAHMTSARAFDLWYSTLHRSPEPVQSLTERLKEDALLLEPRIRRDFAAHWLAQKSPTTVKTYWQHCTMICRAHGILLQPWTLHELKALRDAEQADDQTVIVVERRCPTAGELDAIAQHATAATGPYGEHSPYFWRGLVRFMSCFGLRSRDVVSCVPEKTGLRKQDLIWSEDCPSENVNAALGYTLKNPGGWLWVRIHKANKTHAPITLLPIPAWARGWLKFFSELSHDPVRVFPSSQVTSRSLAQSSLSQAWNKILAAAEVPPNIRLSEGAGGVIAVRKYSANWWRLAVADATGNTERAKDVAAYVMHHSEITRTTADRHYVDVQATVLPTIVDLLDRFPKPAAQARPVSMLPE